MEKIAKFEKVSLKQFLKDFIDVFPTLNENEITKIYEDIKLPLRATIGSAGYDFFMPITITLKPQESIKIPTGIKAYIKDGYVLVIVPRSGLGFKYRLQLDNSIGIIDQDYYFALNEGHIICKITNDSKENKTLEIKQGQGFVQGIFLQYGLTIDDEVSETRIYGFGSTTKN